MAAAPAVASAKLSVSACLSDGSRSNTRVPCVISERKTRGESGSDASLATCGTTASRTSSAETK
jgi:hypothetical protein